MIPFLNRLFGWQGNVESLKGSQREFQCQIQRLLQGTGSGCRFLPARQIVQLTNSERVRGVLPHHVPPDLVEFICRDAKKIFLALVMGGAAEAADLANIMSSMKHHGITDDQLPLPVDVECIGCGDASQCLEEHDQYLDALHDTIWRLAGFRFRSDQRMFDAPVFTRARFVYDLEEECILPFTWKNKQKKDGHFSTVSEAILHPDHEDFERQDQGERRALHVALKELKSLDSESEYNVERAWEHEVSALREISNLRHSHLIRPLAAIKRGPERYIMFEWANGGSLRDVWSQQGLEPRELSADRVMCVLEELKGLAEALASLHNTNNETRTARITRSSQAPGAGDRNSRETESTAAASAVQSNAISNGASSQTLQVPRIQILRDNSDDDDDSSNVSSEPDGSYVSEDPDPDDTEVHWRHGDLKPDNILQFRNGSTVRWLGRLKIADLGLAKQHMFKTSRRNEHTQQKYTTSQYEAPEAMSNLHSPRSRRYDIWSMGCVILEFVIVLLYGNRGLEIFYNERPHGGGSTETLYFTVDRRQGIAEVSNIADHWIKQILRDSECDRQPGSAIGDLVRLVRDRLLVVDLPQDDMSQDELAECRADARELHDRLQKIWMTARDDEHRGGNYLCSNRSRASNQTPQPSGGRRTKAKPGVRFLGDHLQPRRRDQV